MKGPYTTWQNSPHSDVACVECHIAPGMESLFQAKLNGMRQVVQVATNSVPSRPHAEVEDAACLRPGCHQMASLQPEPSSSAYMHKFSHDAHLEQDVRGVPLRCTSCHMHATGQEHFEVDKNVCYTCHFASRGTAEAGVGNCLTCHDLPGESVESFDHVYAYEEEAYVSCVSCHSGVTHGEAPVTSSTCKICHSPLPAGSEDTGLVHRAHVTATKVDCYQCHDEIIHAADTGIQYGSGCVRCHGEDFHQTASHVYAGQGGVGVDDEPSAMFIAGVSCEGCHTHNEAVPVASSGSLLAIAETCDACHGEGSAEFVEMWQQDAREQLAGISSLLSGVPDRLEDAKLAAQTAADVRALVAAAQANYDLVLQDGSYGVHNPGYAGELLAKAQADLEQIDELLASATPAADDSQGENSE